MNSTAQSLSLSHKPATLRSRWFKVQATKPELIFRERTIRGMIPILGFVVLLGAVATVASGDKNVLPILAGLSVVLIGATLAMISNRLNLASFLIFLFPVFAAVGSLIGFGYLSTAGIVMSYFAVLFGAIVLPRQLIKFLPVGMIIVYAIITFSVGPNGPVPDSSPKRSGLSLYQSVEMLNLSLLFFGLGYYLLNEFEKRSRDLRQLVGSLEERVGERTRDLTIAADVSQQVTQVLDIQRLLPELTELVRSSFNLYHVSIFLVDDETKMLRLQAGSGSTGQQLVSHHKQFAPGDHGLVPLAARQRNPQVINDVSQSPDHQANPLLPNTRSEVALPMTLGQTLIGVLDLQSDQVDKFSQDDIKVLNTLAEQIAIAVRNAQLFAETLQSRQDAEQARQDAERANHVKSAFLASMSHELRTPLNAIINFTTFVAEGDTGPVTDTQQETLNEVLGSAKHLLNLINDVLDMSKIEAGSLKLFVEDDVDLKGILQTVHSTARSLIGTKPVKLLLNVDPALPTIRADRQRVLQIFLNIISNACKFTKEGSIRLQANVVDDQVIVLVRDTGPGIAEADQSMVFEAFKQTETGLRQGGGTGLGMPISKSLAEAHGGNLWLESDAGKGATFFVSLPIKSNELTPMFSMTERVA